MCGCDDAEPARMWRAATVTTRKDHPCRECRRTIAAGARAVRVSAMWEPGDFETFYTCRRCSAVREAWRDVEGCYPAVGGLLDEVRECFGELAREGRRHHERDPEIVRFGVQLRAHLGKYGPQQRRAA